MDGKELARRLKAHPDSHNATLMALTGYSEDQELLNAKSYFYLLKISCSKIDDKFTENNQITISQ